MRKKKVEGEYQTDSWPLGPESSLCPLARPDIAMGLESQIEAWSADRSRRLKTSVSHCQFASNIKRKATVSTSETTSHRLRDEEPAERHRGLGCLGHRHRGRETYTLDIPLHRRDLWSRADARQNLFRRFLDSALGLARNDTTGAVKGGTGPAPTGRRATQFRTNFLRSS
jgi:hypothetical protein